MGHIRPTISLYLDYRFFFSWEGQGSTVISTISVTRPMYRVLEVSWERENYDPIKARNSYSVLPAAFLYLPLYHLFTSISQTVANGSNSDSSYLWPAYFVERPNGIFTAPIEGNHLPELIRVRRLPPKLSATDTAGMASVGIKRKRDKRNITLKSQTFQANFILQSHLNTLLAKMLTLLLQPFQAAKL